MLQQHFCDAVSRERTSIDLDDNPAMSDRLRPLGEAAWDALQRMVREILRRKPGGHLIEGRLPEIDLRLALIRRGRIVDAEQFAQETAAAIESQIDDAIEAAAAFQPGNAFCHRCAAAACEHSLPPSSRHVFIGYGATGIPAWQEFAQHCLDLRHPEVDRLFDNPPAFLTFLRDRSDLHGALLAPFESGGRDLLGQVIAGFFTLPARTGEGRGVLALTFQAVASRAADGRVRLGLNLLGRAPEGNDLSMVWERQDDLPWRRAVQWAQAALVSAGQAGSRESNAARREKRVMGILQGLARRLEQDVRGRARRTAHAGERHDAGQRPTRKAIDDIRAARPDHFLSDERTGAVVVLGDRGRTHFFTPEGRLVSSVRYTRDAIERKRTQGIWRPLGDAEARSTREVLLQNGVEKG
jgi:hypothetical protein